MVAVRAHPLTRLVASSDQGRNGHSDNCLRAALTGPDSIPLFASQTGQARRNRTNRVFICSSVSFALEAAAQSYSRHAGREMIFHNSA